MPDPTARRQYPRFQVPGATVSYELHGFLRRFFRRDCPIFTLSKGGLGFQTNSRLKPGQKLAVILTFEEEALIQQIQLRTQVLYCIPHSGTPYRYHVGVAFAPFAVAKGCNSPEALKALDQLEKEYAK